jgi:hypothetical protein
MDDRALPHERRTNNIMQAARPDFEHLVITESEVKLALSPAHLRSNN